MTRDSLSVFEEVLHDLAVVKAIPKHLANVRVNRDLTLQDLGLDSVDRMAIIAELEQRLGNTFPEHQDPPSTIKDVLSWIDSAESVPFEYRGENFDLADVIIRGRRLPLNDRLELCSDLIASVSREYAQSFTRLIEPPLDRKVTVRDPDGHVRRMLMFGSNNYLGLANHPTVIAAVKAAITKYGVGVGGAALLSGHTILHAELEHRLAAMKAAEDAVLFSSGYGAIVGVTAALAGTEDVVYYDQYSHASTADGLKMAKCKAIPFRHNDPASLRAAIETQSDHSELYVAVEGIYSMDGDIAPLDQILNVCSATGARLILDDAHGTAVLGKSGRGTAEHFGVEGKVDVSIGTLSKAFAVTGAFAAASKPVTTYLRYMARSHVFSTALPVVTVAAVLAGLDVLEKECEWLAKLHDNVRYLNKGFEALGIPCRSETPIFVLRVPTKVNMRAAAHRFHERGIFVNAVEYPAVARNEQRFRFSLMATHTQQDLDELLSTTDDVWRNLLNSHIGAVGKS